jgi:Fe-S-cluster containining protein
MNTRGMDNSPLAFFKAMHGAFDDILAQRRGRPELIEGLLSLAFGSFDGNVEIQSEGQAEVDCRKGCAACCRLRVVATAPEVLLIAGFIRTTAERLRERGIDLAQCVAEADADTRGLSEVERITRRRRCPFIVKGACTIYPVRTLACRGHASHDRRACAAAMAGGDIVIPISQPHLVVRGIVQNAMQSALLDNGYAWGLYELNHALHIALTDDGSRDRWLQGEDVLAPAMIDGLNQQEMMRTFAEIKTQ